MTPDNQLTYINENLAPGNWGYFFIVLSFGAALLGLISYLFHTRNSEIKSWRNLGRTAFFVHGASVLGIFGILFYLIYTHQFQYNYVWSHSSRDLPVYYIISAFWEGQEGSFLLWTFWHIILGSILVFTAKRWEGPVMVVMCLAQVMLTSMVLGLEQISVFGATVNLPIKLGSNPFILLRDAFPDLPLFNSPDYVNKIADGRGLNALLQNYWMVIHPPVLFLGFASTIVPFAFAMGGLWHGKYGEWVRPALPWALFNGASLGLGILMGGAWAYEALSFGGFWAWDPVENASLVPWIIMIAGLHTMVIYKARGSALGISYILVTLGFLLILYSTFLTRSGILGDSSVHSFTDLGLSGQLLIFMGVFVVMAAFYLIKHWKKIPKTEKEESVYSREFWMFIGSLVLSLSALHIISITSIPVFNKVSELINSVINTSLRTNYSKPTDVIATFHQLQIPFAIIIAILTGFAQYFKYFKTDSKLFWRKTLISQAIAIAITIPCVILLKINDYRLILLFWASAFTLVGNADIFIGFLRKGKFAVSGPAVAHIGIGLILLGSLIANGKKEVISLNTEGFETLAEASVKEKMENKVLFKNFPVQMNDYRVTYLGDSMDKKHIYFKVNYVKRDKETGKVKEEFTLTPYVIYEEKKDEITAPSPDTRHYLTKDIFTHITSASNKNQPEYQVNYDTSFVYNVNKGETFKIDSLKITVEDVAIDKGVTEGTKPEDEKYKLTMKLKVTDNMFTYYATPSFVLESGTIIPEEAEIKDFGLKFLYRSLDPKSEKPHELVVMKGKRPQMEFITLKAVVFPFINLLWIGCIIMVIGFVISIFRRNKENKFLSEKMIPVKQKVSAVLTEPYPETEEV